jgi:hypothetical protein
MLADARQLGTDTRIAENETPPGTVGQDTSTIHKAAQEESPDQALVGDVVQPVTKTKETAESIGGVALVEITGHEDQSGPNIPDEAGVAGENEESLGRRAEGGDLAMGVIAAKGKAADMKPATMVDHATVAAPLGELNPSSADEGVAGADDPGSSDDAPQGDDVEDG